MENIKFEEILEYGFIIGNIVGNLENNNTITFTNDSSYDSEFVALSKYLIENWGCGINSKHHYFSEYVTEELQLIEVDYKNKNYSDIIKLLFKEGF